MHEAYGARQAPQLKMRPVCMWVMERAETRCGSGRSAAGPSYCEPAGFRLCVRVQYLRASTFDGKTRSSKLSQLAERSNLDALQR